MGIGATTPTRPEADRAFKKPGNDRCGIERAVRLFFATAPALGRRSPAAWMRQPPVLSRSA
jgi:hypothetical protein